MALGWNDTARFSRNKSWTCGFCGNKVASVDGYSKSSETFILICPGCEQPTFFRGFSQTPQSSPGNPVESVPSDLEALYNEARASFAAESYTGAVLLCRKILMHIAVDKGASPNQSFLQFVNFLADENFLTPDGKVWVDYIRTRSNEANHEIVLMPAEDARALITFLEMLLRLIYQFPKMVPQESVN